MMDATKTIKSIVSFIAALRASAALGRAYRLQRQEKLAEAYAVSQKGLSVLRKSYIFRLRPTEASVLAGLNIVAEEIAMRLELPGAAENDLTDSLSFLKLIDGTPQPEYCANIPFLENRLSSHKRDGVTS